MPASILLFKKWKRRSVGPFSSGCSDAAVAVSAQILKIGFAMTGNPTHAALWMKGLIFKTEQGASLEQAML